MSFKTQYQNAKKKLLGDNICNYNISIFKQFLKWEEEKLKRTNDMSTLDNSTYKTLSKYPNMLRNVNNWFKNKPWNELTAEEIRQVYNDLEDGVITNRAGVKFADRRGYYSKIFKAKPFKLAGLGDVVEESLEFFTSKHKKAVRFINEETFLSMISVLQKAHHLALMRLAWDIGENITSLLRIQKKHLKRSVNKQTNDIEYSIYLPEENLKRSRQMRSEVTIFSETAQALDTLFARGREVEYRNKKGQFQRKYEPYVEEDLVFGFGYRQAVNIIEAASAKTGGKCEPNGEKPTWKDLRSGMACNLMMKGWHAEDINLRLGHSPLSRQLDVYINYLSVNKKKAIKDFHSNNLNDIKEKFEEMKIRDKAKDQRLEEFERNQKDTTEAIAILMKTMTNKREYRDTKPVSVEVENKIFELAGHIDRTPKEQEMWEKHKAKRIK